MKALRKALDGLYLAAGALGAMFLLAILCLIVLQMLARWTGQTFPGATDYAGYCMAASSFLTLAYALRRGAHVRVSILLGALGPRRRWGELACTLIGAIVATFFARYAVKATIWSAKLGDVSQGQDATPLWIPQLAMSAGTILLALALWDRLIWIAAGGDPAADAPEGLEP
ncbi:TRAP-type C4-dicarboxylate transport system, small permease component [Oceanicella actignis]|uniref:TRAP transporter small permease protein n=2 Tax=Oceanicella actignis TaxID=1189325 RepID=A0A1M7RVR5_9RHOB|nr:TRAP-type C4-dicarboxylate transport system permease small subunit [Oceanicella actignis]SET01851.1 TRAP-type C4-dicarboxylate transport system, small permease component [Oceanicella actignis]SHN50246.1 TRAP-type C4-dicarboxylate transport system, small permease component [Oceanicella actignis]